MDIKIRQTDGYSIIDLPSNILSSSLGLSIKELVALLVEKNFDRIVINCENITKIDSLGLGALLSIQKICLFNGSTVSICGLQPQVSELIYQTRMNRLIKIFDSELDAMNELDELINIKDVAINN